MARFAPGVAGRRPLRARRRRRRPAARRAGVAAGPAAGAGAVGEGRPAAPARDLLAVLARRTVRQRRGRLGGRRAARRALGARRAVLPRRRATARPAAGRRRAAGRRGARAAARAAGPRRLLLLRPSGRVSRTSPPRSCARRSGTSPGPGRRPTTPSRRCARAAPRRRARRRGRGVHPRGASVAGPAATPPLQGRWSLAEDVFRCRRGRPGGAAARLGGAAARASRSAHARARARRGIPGRLLRAVPGAVGARDAGRGPPRLLRRGPGRRPVRVAGRRRAASRRRRRRRRPRSSSPPPTRRSSTAPACAGRTRGRGRRHGAPARTWSRSAAVRRCRSTPAAARCAVVGRPDDVQPALEALAAAVRAGRLRRLALDTIDGEPAVASPLAERLVALGFRRGLHDFALAPGDA